jgi:hypothetical protein
MRIFFALIIMRLIILAPQLVAQNLSSIRVGYFTDGALSKDPFSGIAYDHCLILKQIGQTLVELAASGEVMPGIAKRWDISLDRKTYTFFIDKSFRFHNGQHITAYDVEASLTQAALTPDGPSQYYFHVVKGFGEGLRTGKIVGFKALDSETFRITLKRPFSPLLRALTSGSMIILPESTLGRTTQGRELTGSGPYKIAIHNGHRLVLEPFPLYKGPYSPSPSTLEILEDTDLVTSRRLPSDSELPDYDHDVIGERIELYQNRGYQFKRSSRLAVSTFVPNPKALNSPGVRRAIFRLILESVNDLKRNRPAVILRDMYPKGVLGFENNPKSYGKLLEEIQKTDLKILNRHFKELRFGLPGSLLWDADSLAKKITQISGIPVLWIPLDPNELPRGITHFEIHGMFFNWANIFPDPESNIESFRMLRFLNHSKNHLKIFQLLKQASESALDSERAFNYRMLRDFVFAESLYLPLYQFERIEALKPGLTITASLYRQTPMLGELIRVMP